MTDIYSNEKSILRNKMERKNITLNLRQNINPPCLEFSLCFVDYINTLDSSHLSAGPTGVSFEFFKTVYFRTLLNRIQLRRAVEYELEDTSVEMKYIFHFLRCETFLEIIIRFSRVWYTVMLFAG